MGEAKEARHRHTLNIKHSSRDEVASSIYVEARIKGIVNVCSRQFPRPNTGRGRLGPLAAIHSLACKKEDTK